MIAVDVAVLGGGPAGTAAGLTLLQRDGVSVAVVEASEYDAPRIGESLTPGARPLLEYFGLWERFRAEQSLEAFGSRAAWGSEEPGTLDYLFTVHGNGWSLDRTALDRLFADAFRERGGRLLTGTRWLDAERADDGWVLALRRADGHSVRMRSRFVIDAAGRRSRFARRLGTARVAHDHLAAAARFGRLPAGRTLDACVEVEACADGWWYTAPIPGTGSASGGVVAAFLTDGDLLRRLGAARADRWEALAARRPLVRERLRDADFSSPPRVFSAASTRLRRAGGEGWVAVGDAVASHDPLSSSGIPHALGTGIQGAVVAADALFAEGRALAAYDEAVQADFLRYLRTRWNYYQREGRFDDEPFWRRRRTSIAFDPRVAIERVEVETADEAASIHLPERAGRRLLAACAPGRAAHEVVRAVADEHPEIADQRIILGLQEWIERGALRLG